jgi:transcriptional regulator with XRE-family HTH domain
MAKAQHRPRYRPLPALLRELREKAGLTQRELATRLHISHVAVHKSEVGERRVDLAEFCDWSTACGTRPERAIKQFLQAR